jgi:hypothetical protein
VDNKNNKSNSLMNRFESEKKLFIFKNHLFVCTSAQKSELLLLITFENNKEECERKNAGREGNI